MIKDSSDDRVGNDIKALLNYRLQEILESQKQIITCGMSNNELHFAYANIDGEVVIIAIPQIIALKQLNFKKPLTLCKFSLQDVYLCVGSEDGFLNFLKVQNNFILGFKIVINQQDLQSFLFISQSEFIVCLEDYAIRLFTKNRMLLKIQKAHNYSILGLDYDHINNTIISCSADIVKQKNALNMEFSFQWIYFFFLINIYTSIKFFNRFNGQRIIQKQLAHDNTIFQIQYIENNQMLSRSYRDIILWQIDYTHQQLINLQKIELPDTMFNICSLSCGNLIVICDIDVFIFDNNLKILQIINDYLFSIYLYLAQKLNTPKFGNYVQKIILQFNKKILLSCISLFQIFRLNKNIKLTHDNINIRIQFLFLLQIIILYTLNNFYLSIRVTILFQQYSKSSLNSTQISIIVFKYFTQTLPFNNIQYFLYVYFSKSQMSFHKCKYKSLSCFLTIYIFLLSI